jgi:DNA-binding transcriptional MerR regulator
MNSDVADPAPHEGGLRIHQVSTLLGVPAPTLRSWERRYGLPTTVRSRGGHRRYMDNELRQLRLMRDEVAHGRRAADAALRVRMLLDDEDPAAAWITELLDASAGMQPRDIEAVLDRAEQELTLPRTVDAVLLPALRQVGNWWETGRCDVAQEHLTTETVRHWLSRRTVLGGDPTGPAVVLACGPRDQHSVGLEALAALLAPHRIQSHLTGARTPPDALLACMRRTRAAAAVVVSQLPTNRRASVEALTVAAQTERPLFYAGNAFLFATARKGVPGTYLGESISGAADRIVESVTR